MSSVLKLVVCIAATALVSVAHATTASPAPFNEEIVRVGHSFELGNGDSMLLARHRKPVAYRVCIEDEPGVVPLKLMVDGQAVDVKDGTCTDVVGKHISVKPSERLPDGSMLVGRFELVKK
jgi:hypothetical protein